VFVCVNGQRGGVVVVQRVGDAEKERRKMALDVSSIFIKELRAFNTHVRHAREGGREQEGTGGTGRE